MFSRLRETIRVLSHREDLFTRPDIAFDEDEMPKPTRFSNAIAGLLEIAALAVVAGLGGYIVHAGSKSILGPTQTGVFSSILAGIASGLIAFLGSRSLHEFNAKLELRLKIAERIAPYFGHRLEETFRVLRG